MALFKKAKFWTLITAVLSGFAGIQMIITGKFRSIIFESREKYVIGGVFIFIGLYIFILLIQQIFKARARVKKTTR